MTDHTEEAEHATSPLAPHPSVVAPPPAPLPQTSPLSPKAEAKAIKDAKVSVLRKDIEEAIAFIRQKVIELEDLLHFPSKPHPLLGRIHDAIRSITSHLGSL